MKARTPLLIATLCASLFVVGCQTTNPYTQEQQTSKATKGALIGAAGGIAAGLLAGDDAKDRRQKALIGATAGGAIGGGIGYYMDQQEAKLRQEVEGTGVSVARHGDNLMLNMPGNVTFQTDSADINASFYQVLNSVTLVLAEYEKTLINVAGHTDSDGSDQYNMELSQRRADSVASYLRSRQIDPGRINSRGYGETSPIADNNTQFGKAQNRRVELTLVPYQQQQY